MPDVVTFNIAGPGLFIEEISTGGDNETDLVEIYSEWKVWAALSDNMKYPPAFRPVGGDPISDVQDLGSTFFLNTGDGWRLRPAELDHQWTINGNLFTDPAGLNPIAPTIGPYTALVKMFVSNLVTSTGTSGLTGPEAAALLEVWQRLGLDSINPMTITDAQISAAAIVLTIAQPDSNTTTVTRQ